MIKEAYCSYEISRLLKEKGFDEHCDNYYDQSLDEPQQLTIDEMYYSCDEFIKAPTHQMACAWLREKHNIFIEISVSIDLNDNYYYNYSILNRECKYVRKRYTAFDWNYEDTYEDAVEAALKYALENLIKEQQ